MLPLLCQAALVRRVCRVRHPCRYENVSSHLSLIFHPSCIIEYATNVDCPATKKLPFLKVLYFPTTLSNSFASMCIQYWNICLAEIPGRCYGLLRLERSELCEEGRVPSECPNLKDETDFKCCALCHMDLESMSTSTEELDTATLASRMECVQLREPDPRIPNRSPADITRVCDGFSILKDLGDNGAWFVPADGRPVYRIVDPPHIAPESLDPASCRVEGTAKPDSKREVRVLRYGNRERSRSPGRDAKAKKFSRS